MESLYADKIKCFDENYPIILEEIAEAARRSGRESNEITLLAATKTVPVEVINHAISRGLRHMGENRVQELQDKYQRLNREDCDLQFIGQLQTNKIKYIIDKVSCIQSVGSVRLAQEISRQCEKRSVVMPVLVEVNIGKEESKGGVMPEALLEAVDEIRSLRGIAVNGLMAIPPICVNNAELCRYFSAMHQYYVDIAAKKIDNVSMNCLSMGMSSDFVQAIECGANMIRVGSSLFGKREFK